jgi:hypothetical protein
MVTDVLLAAVLVALAVFNFVFIGFIVQLRATRAEKQRLIKAVEAEQAEESETLVNGWRIEIYADKGATASKPYEYRDFICIRLVNGKDKVEVPFANKAFGLDPTNAFYAAAMEEYKSRAKVVAASLPRGQENL